MQKANADAIRLLNEAMPNDKVLALRSLEALAKVANGKHQDHHPVGAAKSGRRCAQHQGASDRPERGLIHDLRYPEQSPQLSGPVQQSGQRHRVHHARDINNLPAGRTRIDGDKAVVTVSTVTPQASDKASFVRHDNHLTLETDLEGSELFEVSLGEFSPTRPADKAADTTVGTAGTSIAGMLCEGRFALYLPGSRTNPA